MRNIFKLDVTRMLRNHYQVRLHGYDPTEGREIVYKALFNKENTLSLLKELYHNRHLPSLEENWSIERMKKSQPGTMCSMLINSHSC